MSPEELAEIEARMGRWRVVQLLLAEVRAATRELAEARMEIARLCGLLDPPVAKPIFCKNCPFARHVHYEEDGKLVTPSCAGFEAEP